MSSRISNALVMLVLLGLTASGCGAAPPERNDLSGLSREGVITDFAADPASALRRYKALWHSETASGRPPTPATIALAGELMRADPGNYDIYYRFSLTQTGSQDIDVVSAALSALSRAKGRESIDLLVKMAGDERPEVAASALIAIDYRIATSTYEPLLSDDHAYLQKLMPNICSLELASLVRSCRE